MKKYLLLLIVFCISVSVGAQFHKHKVNQWDSKGQRQGLWLTYLDTTNKGALISKEYYKDGRETGVCRYYHTNGNVRLKFKFLKDNIKVKYFDERHKLTRKGWAKMDYTEYNVHYYWEGIWKFYGKHRKLKTVAMFSKGNSPVVLKGEPLENNQ